MTKSVHRLVRVLEALAARPEGLSMAELSHATGLNKATASRLVSSLADCGIIVRVDSSPNYVIGVRLWGIAGSALDHCQVRKVAVAPMIQAARSDGLATALGVLAGSHSVTIVGVNTNQGAIVVTPGGTRAPAYANAIGKVLLAFSPPTVVERVLSELTDGPPNSGSISKSMLIEELQEIKKRGFGSHPSVSWPNARAIAAPIFDYSGRAAAAIACAYIISEEGAKAKDQDRERDLIAKILDVGLAISAALGHPGHTLPFAG